MLPGQWQGFPFKIDFYPDSLNTLIEQSDVAWVLYSTSVTSSVLTVYFLGEHTETSHANGY